MDRQLQDIKKKLDIFRRIVSAQDVDHGTLGPDKLFEIYTGYAANPTLISETCSYEDYLKNKGYKPKNLESLRQKLIDCYLNQRKPPKLEDIDSLRDPTTEPGVDKFFYSLLHNGFTWKNIPGTSKALFAEKYENIANRLRYLMKMKEYREAGRHIVYLEDISHLPNVKGKSFMAVSNKMGVLSCVTKTSKEFKSYLNPRTLNSLLLSSSETISKQKQMLSSRSMAVSHSVRYNPPAFSALLDSSSKSQDHLIWMKEHVLNVVTEPCVFVYEEFPLSQSDILGHYSSKHDMMNYLDQNGVPYARKAHRFELYELIKRLTKAKPDQLSDIITSKGHDTILRPYEFKDLDFYHWFWDHIRASESFIFDIVMQADLSLIAAEEKIYTEDRMMDEVLDKMMTLGKYEGEADDNLTEYRDVMKYDSEYGVESVFVD